MMHPQTGRESPDSIWTFPKIIVQSTFHPLNRRRLIRVAGAFGLRAGLQRVMPAYAFENTGLKASPIGDSEADERDVLIHEQPRQFGKGRGAAITIKGTVPGPLVRLREGSDAILRVTNGSRKTLRFIGTDCFCFPAWTASLA